MENSPKYSQPNLDSHVTARIRSVIEDGLDGIGTRRARLDAGRRGTRAAVIGGANGPVMFGQEIFWNPLGTHAHSLVQVYEMTTQAL